MNGLPKPAASARLATVRAMVTRASCITFACAILVAGPVAAQVAPLLNGNFEAAPQINGYTYVSAGSHLSGATGWKVTAGDVNIGTTPAGTLCQGGVGHCVDLNGSSRGGIEQSMESKAGSRCTVTFWMSRHLQRTSATLQTFVNNVATSPATFTHNTAGISPTDGKWQQHSFSFTSVAPSTTIAFVSAMSGAAGPQVDNVTMTCASPSGSLSVQKIVVNNVGPSAPIPPTFDTTTHCSASAGSSSVNTPLAVPGGQTVLQPGTLPAGTICSVTEVVPQHIAALEACKGRGATWTETHSGPVTIVAGQTAVLTETNTLDCDKPTGGTLQAHKTVVNTLGVPTPSSFTMTATCTGMAPIPLLVPVDGTVTVPPGGLIPDGTVCTIAETIPPQVTGVKACPSGTATWVPSNPGPLTVHTGQTTGTIITNTLTCDPPRGGHLTVNKVIVNTTGGPAPIPPTFDVAAQCTLSGANTLNVTLPVPSNGGLSAAPPIAVGSICNIHEGLLAKIPNLKACNGATASWTSSYSGPVTMLAGGATLTATNTLACDKPTEPARFEIRKNTGATVIPGTYLFNLNCTRGGTPVSVTSPVQIVLPGTGFTTISVPGGASCVVTEQSPGSNWNPSPVFTGSGGLTVIPGGGLVATVGPVTGTSGVVTVMNERKPDSAGCPDRTQTSIGCRVTVTIRRAKGPATYSVIPSQAATYPMSNSPPSTGSACVIAGNAMINQTTCWFNYSASSSMITLSTASSTGSPPLANWTGDCNAMNSATCMLPAVTQATPRSVVVTFP
ncbi:MAG: DUF5979 domain-containing protein [Rhodoferax sp.]|uniref:DUF5979 domain-containing protein n=1 Tax=Rhodoferax sp. TaxID=50421 RepID=UPI002627037E|nr:DUF5979 domain-containing protein [Rhodoferax sp.]MDD5333456.1 DUF5979 domain-containing protein [Rhodoferax sp.]